MNNKLSLALGTALVVALGWMALQPATADESGSWQCYIGDKFPDVQAAGEWRGAQKVSEGLNQVAGHVSRGEIITVPYPIKMGMGSQVSAPLLCIKN